MVQLIWSGCAVTTALAIAFDMHQLRTRRIGLTLASWIVASACAGPIAGAIYLGKRAAAKRALVNAAWTLVGDASVPIHVRRDRLIALKQAGLMGPSIYRACSEVLDTEMMLTGRCSQNRTHPAQTPGGKSNL